LHIFQEYGKTPVLIDKLNKAVKLGTMLSTVAFSILAEILTAPVALLQSQTSNQVEHLVLGTQQMLRAFVRISTQKGCI